MIEKWKDIPGYKGSYQASSLGRIRSLDRVVKHCRGGPKNLKGKILLPTKNKGGYGIVGIQKTGKSKLVSVHQLVLLCFVGPCPIGKEVCHGPNGVADNSLENLSYGTRSQNQRDRIRDGTSDRRAVQRSDGIVYASQRIAAEVCGLYSSHISEVCTGKRITAGGYSWKFV